MGYMLVDDKNTCNWVTPCCQVAVVLATTQNCNNVTAQVPLAT